MRDVFRVTKGMRSKRKIVAAVSYADAGLPVLPIWGISNGQCDCMNNECSSPGKHPIGSICPNGHKDATTDESKIREIWRLHPNANIGIVASDGLVIYDQDGERGAGTIAGLNLRPTATVKTGRGHHYYFLGELPEHPPKLEGVDYRYNGKGYVVAPPSKHISGINYEWELSVLDAAKPVPDERKNVVRIDFTGVGKNVGTGERNNQLAEIAGVFRQKGWNSYDLRKLLTSYNTAFCTPPLKSIELTRIANSIGSYPSFIEDAFGSMADLKAEEVEWLYRPYIPRGVITGLVGEPGSGKSSFTLALTAALTTGARVTWSTDRPKGRVLLLSAEDDPARVMKPRLASNKADDAFIRYQREPFSLDDRGIELMKFEMESFRPDLVIIDPVIAFMGSGEDLHKATDMTRFMASIDNLAREFDCAILIVRHARKSVEGSHLNRALGSIAVTARVRSELTLGRHPNDENKRALAHIKSNYAQEGPAIVFSFKRDGATGQRRIQWEPSDPLITADDLLPSGEAVGRPPKEQDSAKEFLNKLLSNGEKEKSEIYTAAKMQGISEMTVRRAATAMKLKKIRKGKQSFWRLP